MENSTRRYEIRRRGFFASLLQRSLTFQMILFTSILSIIVFFVASAKPELLRYVALEPLSVIHGKYLWTLLTHIFVHGDIIHLIINMISLAFIGSFVEKLIGRKRFFWFYMISGIFAGAFFVASAWIGSTMELTSIFGALERSGVGASGALFGLLGILAIILPSKKVYLIAGPIVLIVAQVIFSPLMPENYATLFDLVMNVLIFLMIFSFFTPNTFIGKLALPLELPLWLAPIIAIAPLMIVSIYVDLPIGNTAHLGGLIVGLIYGAYLRDKYRKKVILLNRMIR